MHCSNLLPPPTLQIYMTGTSAGGMMVEHLLCSSALIPNTIAAAVDIIGGAGTPLRDSCNPAVKVPLRILHGEEDPVLHFNESTEVDGSPFMSTSERGGLSCESVRVCTLWKALYACGAAADLQASDDNTTTCLALCPPASASAPDLELCMMRGIGHSLDHPWRGYPFYVAW